ncbi:MAG: hypothetical protein ACKOQS_01935, partial [Dolichospermum sp.]
VKGFEDAIARLKDELHDKDMQLSELTNQLHDKDMQLPKLTNQLHDKDMQLSELTNQLHDKDMQLSELTNQLHDKNMQLSELTNQLSNSNNKPTELDNELSIPLSNSDTKLSKEQIIKILGIDEIIQNEKNKDFKIYIEWLEEQGIATRITTHRMAIELTLGIKIDLKKILGSLKIILEALGYTTKSSKNRAKNMINSVSTDITSYSYFTLI